MISVIIPVLNEEKMLSETLQHVLIQPGEYEIIVVDGGSVDRTCEIAHGEPAVRSQRNIVLQLEASRAVAENT